MFRIIRRPGLHFLILGAALFAVSRGVSTGDGRATLAREPIIVTGQDIERIRRDFEEQYGKWPDHAEEERLVREAVDEEILHREALALGLQRGDRVVRRRLVKLGGFLREDGEPQVDDAELEHEARVLGLDRTDIVIRRYLVQAMRLLLSKPHPEDLPTPEALETYYAAHRSEYRQPAMVRLTHVYLSRDHRGDATAADATRILETLRRTDAGPDDAGRLGEPFARGADIGPVPESELDGIFGPGFLAALAGASPGAWTGPIPSAYGMHLVWVHEWIPGESPPLEVVRSQVVHAFLRARRDERLRRGLQELRKRYEIRIEGAPPAA